MSDKTKSIVFRFLRSLGAYLIAALIAWLSANYIELINKLISDPQLGIIIIAVVGAIIQAADKARRMRKE